VKGGDFRSREANVYRLAQISRNVIDQCAAQGVPFAREYGGLLANRSFGGAQVSRTFYARGQTGQQLLLGAYQAMEKEIAKGGIRQSLLHPAPIDGHSGERRLSVEADADVGIVTQRRTRLGAEAKGRLSQAAEHHSRRRSLLLPRAEISCVRQPFAARHRLAL